MSNKLEDVPDYGMWNKTERLDHTNFAQKVVNDNSNAWVIAFMNPACPDCERFVP
jgi:hypothetical protein